MFNVMRKEERRGRRRKNLTEVFFERDVGMGKGGRLVSKQETRLIDVEWKKGVSKMDVEEE